MWFLPSLAAAWPGLRVVHVVRDGRDIAWSGQQASESARATTPAAAASRPLARVSLRNGFRASRSDEKPRDARARARAPAAYAGAGGALRGDQPVREPLPVRRAVRRRVRRRVPVLR